MSLTHDDLTEGFQRAGVCPGMKLMVHSSLRKFGHVDGGARTVIEALQEVVTEDGTLLLPSFNHGTPFQGGGAGIYDPRETPTPNGIIPETFKFHFAEHFSVHPTHSLMALGPNAKQITGGHEHAGLPCGPGTPWAKNAESGGKILLIGVGFHSNTTFHCAEEQLPTSYRLSAEPVDGIVVLDGREMVVSSRLHLWGVSADFSVLRPELEALGHLRNGRIGSAPTLCFDARGFLDLAISKLACDPRYFIKQK